MEQMFKNFEVLYYGQSSPDRLGVLSVSKELFDRFKDGGQQITIGGGYNGLYHLVPAEIIEDGRFVILDETTNESGIDSLTGMLVAIQGMMNWDGGGYISLYFIQRLKTIATPEEYAEALKCLRFRIQQHSGQE